MKVPRGELRLGSRAARQLFCQSSSAGLFRARHVFDLQPPWPENCFCT